MLKSVVLVLFALSTSGLAAELPPASPAAALPPPDVVPLERFVVEESSAPAVLKLSFRKHMMWAGIKTLTFTSVPATWAKAGIAVGDRVIAIDGRTVDGMRLVKDFGALMKAKFAPFKDRATREVPFTFDLQPKDSTTTRRVAVILKGANPFTVSAGL